MERVTNLLVSNYYMDNNDKLQAGQLLSFGVRYALHRGIGLGSSFVILGILLSTANFSPLQAFFSTFTIYAMPAQIVLVDQFLIGSSLFSVWVAVMLANIRFIPMAMVLSPHIGQHAPAWQLNVAAFFVAITGWVSYMGVYKRIDPVDRMRFFLTFSVALWCLSCACTMIGYYIANRVTPEWLALLTYINPIYLMALMLVNDTEKPVLLSIIGGGVLGIIFTLVMPTWGVIFAGIAVGTGVYFYTSKDAPHEY